MTPIYLTLVVWKDTSWVIYNTNSHNNCHPTQIGDMNSHCLGHLQHKSPRTSHFDGMNRHCLGHLQHKSPQNISLWWYEQTLSGSSTTQIPPEHLTLMVWTDTVWVICNTNPPEHLTLMVWIVTVWVICNTNPPEHLTLMVWIDTVWVIYNTNPHNDSHPPQTGGLNSHCLGHLQHKPPKWLPSISDSCYD